jgi:hypothetical protein
MKLPWVQFASMPLRTSSPLSAAGSNSRLIAGNPSRDLLLAYFERPSYRRRRRPVSDRPRRFLDWRRGPFSESLPEPQESGRFVLRSMRSVRY